jgi:predicted nucleotidyltransferase
MREEVSSNTLKKLERFFEKDQKVHQVILFGSYAREEQTARSDMDIAIQLAKPMLPKQKLYYLEKIQEYTGTSIDLVDLLRVGQPLLSQIMKYGKRLKGSSTQYAELAVRNVNTAQDFLPGIRRLMKARRERLLNG